MAECLGSFLACAGLGHGQHRGEQRMREAYFTYEYKKISELFFEMKSASIPMAIVLDEYGSTSGILTSRL